MQQKPSLSHQIITGEPAAKIVPLRSAQKEANMRSALTYLSPMSWRLLAFAPIAAALVLLGMGSTETDMHRRNELFILANLAVSVGIIAQGAYLVVAKKRTWPGLSVVIVGALVLGFGLHVLLRVLHV